MSKLLHDIAMLIQAGLYTLVVTVILRYTISTVVLDLMDRYVKKWLIRTEEDAIYWLHYHNRAARIGHMPKHPLHCQDDDCTKVTK